MEKSTNKPLKEAKDVHTQLLYINWVLVEVAKDHHRLLHVEDLGTGLCYCNLPQCCYYSLNFDHWQQHHCTNVQVNGQYPKMLFYIMCCEIIVFMCVCCLPMATTFMSSCTLSYRHEREMTSYDLSIKHTQTPSRIVCGTKFHPNTTLYQCSTLRLWQKYRVH